MLSKRGCWFGFGLRWVPTPLSSTFSPTYVSTLCTKFGNTALHEAAENNHLEIVQLLVQKGASFDLQNKVMSLEARGVFGGLHMGYCDWDIGKAGLSCCSTAVLNSSSWNVDTSMQFNVTLNILFNVTLNFLYMRHKTKALFKLLRSSAIQRDGKWARQAKWTQWNC